MAGATESSASLASGGRLHEVTEDRVLGFVIDQFGGKEVHVYDLEKP